jgi:hypothetical protein
LPGETDFVKISIYVTPAVRKRIEEAVKDDRRASFMHQGGILVEEALDARDKKAGRK